MTFQREEVKPNNNYFGLWRKENSAKIGGKVTIDGKDYWVSMYEADPSKYKQNPPLFNIRFDAV